MKSKQSSFALLLVYAAAASIILAQFLIRDFKTAVYHGQQYKDSIDSLSSKASISTNEDRHSQQQPRAIISERNNTRPKQSKERQGNFEHPPALFPIKKHMVTHGHPRTATTLLFNMVSVSYFLHLLRNDPQAASKLQVQYRRRDSSAKFLRHRDTPYVIKTHNEMSDFLGCEATIFTTAMDKEEARETEKKLSKDGHSVAFVQDMESLKEFGVPGLVKQYVEGFGLTQKEEEDMIEYFANWEILRQCCGKQMSSRWRNDLFPEHLKKKSIKHHPTCGNYDIDSIEQAFMKTTLFQLIQQYPKVRPMNKPSLLDDNLNGTYCSSYNNLVHEKGLYFWGAEGERSIRSDLENAIKNEFNLGTNNLLPEGEALLFNTTYKTVWRLPKEEQESWLERVQSARIKRGT